MSYLDLASDLVKRLEACRLVGYPDSGGKPTNGYGHTGDEVQIGAPITQEIADHNLAVDLATADRRLRACVDADAFLKLDEHEKAALVSFVFNLGAKPEWTIWKDVDNDNLDDVPVQMRRFDHGVVNGTLVEIPGLEHRREAEIVFWRTADAAQATAVIESAPVTAPPSGYTRDLETPPVPLPPQPMAKTSMAVKIGTAVAGIGATASQLHGVVAPAAAESPLFQHIAVVLTGCVVLAACTGILIAQHQHAQRAV